MTVLKVCVTINIGLLLRALFKRPAPRLSHRHSVCKAQPEKCTKVPAAATKCGDMYIFIDVLLQYEEDRVQNCSEMYVSDSDRPGID